MYRVFSDKTGLLHIGVLTGGIGIFEVTVTLSDDQAQRFRAGERVFLDDFAGEVARNYSKYLSKDDSDL